MSIKILYVCTHITGHYISYLNALLESFEHDAVVMLPENIKNLEVTQYVYKTSFLKKRNIIEMLRFLNEVKSCADRNNVNIIHFLEVDFLRRYFGFGLDIFNNYKTVATMHHIREGFIYQLSNYLLSRCFNKVIVHSEYLKNIIEKQGVKNVLHIEYPQFNKMTYKKGDALKYFGLNPDITVIGCIGATRKEKGLDILLEALNGVKDEAFQLLIAGLPGYFDDTFILEHSMNYAKKVFRYSKFMTEEELAKAFCACDIICLPYRKIFNGASGPLGEGVNLNKCIIGPNCRNLGHTIESNHLGYTFISENAEDLGNVIRFALNNKFEPDDYYLSYKLNLNPQHFKLFYKKVFTQLINNG